MDAHGEVVRINTTMNGPEVGTAVPVHVVKAFLRETLGSADSHQVIQNAPRDLTFAAPPSLLWLPLSPSAPFHSRKSYLVTDEDCGLPANS